MAQHAWARLSNPRDPNNLRVFERPWERSVQNWRKKTQASGEAHDAYCAEENRYVLYALAGEAQDAYGAVENLYLVGALFMAIGTSPQDS